MPHTFDTRGVPMDRFIPRRSTSTFEFSPQEWGPVPTKDKNDENYFFTNTAKERYRLKNYKETLKSILFSGKNRVLEFSNIKHDHNYFTKRNYSNHWPVESRNKPLLPSTPCMELDMPDLDTHYCKNLVDWGRTGYIATTYDREVHLWHPVKKTGKRVTNFSVRDCIRWNRTGSHFAMSVADGRMALFNLVTEKTIVPQTICPCREMDWQINTCQILSMEWTKSNQLITGCSNGTLTCWSSNMDVINFRFGAHSGEIMKIVISSDEKYLASAGNDKMVIIWNFPHLEKIQEVKFLVPTKALAWHPWKGSLIAVGEITRFHLWNVQNKRDIRSAFYLDCVIDSLTFNPMSAELVVSMFDMGAGISYLKVFKNIDTEVDELRCNEHRMPYLLWNETETQLGTASTEENFCIWDFFGKSTNLENKYLKAQRRMFSTNPLRNMTVFGAVIR